MGRRRGTERERERRTRTVRETESQEEWGVTLRWRQAFRRACGVSCGGQDGRSERSFGRSPDTGKV